MNTIKKIPIEVGCRYTIYSLSGMASTLRREITITDVLDEPLFVKSYVSQLPTVEGTWRLGIFKLKNKRKTWHVSLKPTQDLIVPGWWNLPSDADAYHCFQGNACLNIVGGIEEVKELITKNINPNFTAYDTILAFPRPYTSMPEHDGLMVFPEAQTSHAVIERMRHKVSKRAHEKDTTNA